MLLPRLQLPPKHPGEVGRVEALSNRKSKTQTKMKTRKRKTKRTNQRLDLLDEDEGLRRRRRILDRA
jgi:hypothetical protein